MRVGRPDAPRPQRLGAAGLLAPGGAAGDRRRVHRWSSTTGRARIPDVQLRRLGDAGARAAQGEAAAGRRRRPPARRRVDRQLLAAAVLEGGHVQPLDPYWPAEDRARLPAVHDRDAVGSQPATSTACGTRPTAACSSTARISCPTPPRTWDELLDTASRIARERKHRRVSLQRRPLGSDGLRSPADVLGAGRRARRRRRAPDVRTRRRTATDGARARLPARHDPDAARRRDRCSGTTTTSSSTAAAIAGDVAMFLGGNWQLSDLQAGLPPAEFAKWDIAPIPQADAGTRVDRHRRLGLGGLRARPGAAARRDEVPHRRVEAPTRARISEATGQLAGAPERLSRLPDLPPGPVVRALRRDASRRPARPAVPIYPAISEQLQLAIGYAVSGEKTPERALDDAWRAVRRYARAARQRAAGGASSGGSRERAPVGWRDRARGRPSSCSGADRRAGSGRSPRGCCPAVVLVDDHPASIRCSTRAPVASPTPHAGDRITGTRSTSYRALAVRRSVLRHGRR